MTASINMRCLAEVTLLLSFSDCFTPETNWFFEFELFFFI